MVDAGTGIAIFYLVIGSIVTALITAWLTYMYARPGTSIWVLLSTFFSWYLTFATFFYLLPVDLYYVAQDFYRPVWGFVYWVSFTLTWVFLPVQQTYAEAGEFTFGARLWAAIRFNTIFYVIAGVIVGGFLIYIAVQNQFGSDQVVGLIVMLANTWGLTLAVISLGYGLVEVPRTLWNNANRQVRLNRVRWLASNVSAELADARDQVAYALKLVRIAQQKVPANDPLAPYLAEVEGNLPQNQTVDTTTRARIVDIEDTKLKKQLEEGPMTIRLLADLNYFVKQTTRTLSLSEDHWAELLDKEEFLQQLVAAANGEAVIGREGWRGKLWNIRVFSGPLIGRTLAVIFALVSIILVWGELVLYHPELSPFAQLLNALKGTGGAVFFATCILSYQTICAVYALFSFRVMKFYHMHFNRRTDENSILFNAALLLRLIGPMGYNFLQLTNMAEDGGTVFVDVVGKMDHVPFFGTSLPVYLPILISVFCFGSLFHVYGRIMRILGVKRFDYSASAMTDDVVQEGASLLAKARRRKEHEKNIASRPSVSAAAAAIRAPRASKFGISDSKDNILLDDHV